MPQFGFFLNAIDTKAFKRWVYNMDANQNVALVQRRLSFYRIPGVLIHPRVCQGGRAGRVEDLRGNSVGGLEELEMNEVKCPPVTRSNFPFRPPLITASGGKWWRKGKGWGIDEGIWAERFGSCGTTGVCVKCNKVSERTPGSFFPLASTLLRKNPVDSELSGNPSKSTSVF